MGSMIGDLPDAVIVQIFSYLSPVCMVTIGRTAKLFGNPDNHLWKIYCEQRGLNLDTKNYNNWKQLFHKYAHIPSHIAPDNLDKLTDYDEESLLRAKNKKWGKIFSKWGYYSTKKRKTIREAIAQGIPMSLRGKFWEFCLQLNDFPAVNFEELAATGRAKGNVSQYVNLDYPRISPYFKKAPLLNVVGALTMYDSEIFYTPAMGILAAMLLNYLEEEKAFRALAKVMDGKYALKGMFVEGLPKLRIGDRIFNVLFEKHLNRLYVHCCPIVEQILAIPMLGIFTSLRPNVGMDKVWDMIMFDGYDIMFCVLLALLKTHEEKLMKEDEEHVFMLFIRLALLSDVTEDANNNNIANSPPTSRKVNAKLKSSFGNEVMSVGERIRMDKLIQLTYKYHKRMSPQIQFLAQQMK